MLGTLRNAFLLKPDIMYHILSTGLICVPNDWNDTQLVGQGGGNVDPLAYWAHDKHSCNSSTSLSYSMWATCHGCFYSSTQ